MGSNIHEMPGLTLDDLLQYPSEPISNSLFPNQAQTIQTSMNNTNSFSNSFFTPSPSNSNLTSNSNSNSTNSNSNSSNNQDASEDSVIFSDFVFSYIDQMLMEEERYDGRYQPEEMLATEQQFSAILGGGPTDEPPLVQRVPSQHGLSQLEPVQNIPLWPPDLAYNNSYNNYNEDVRNIPYEIISNDHSLFYSDEGNYNYDNNFNGVNGWGPYDIADLSQIENNTELLFADTNSHSPSATTNTTNSSRSENQNISTPNIINNNNKNKNNNVNNTGTLAMGLEESMFRKGVEEAQKFLPKTNNLVINLDSIFTPSEPTPQSENRSMEIKVEETDQRGRKNPYEEDEELELEAGKRNNKQFAYTEEEYVREMFDKVLLGGQERCTQDMEELRAAKHNEDIRNANLLQSIISSNGKGRGRRKSSKEVVDLRTILIHCAQAVATDDRRSANELLRQIRQHASPTGDATQRLARCFADGLQARLGGTGSHLYQSLIAKRTSAAELLKAYQLYMAACPFKKVSFFFSNQTILDIAEGAERVHIIDFGIHYGFQWPCLLQRLANRANGPPLLKITGIGHPQPGFRPAELIRETGRRLSDYAALFKVPFQFCAIASKWEDVKIEDLDIDENEITVVNCLFQLKNLPDETVTTDSPRDKVLKTIREINPNVFIHGIVNGSFSAPFFVTRFREVLFHYSAMFDMLDANVPRENEHRLLIERDLFGRSALNVIACEGVERIERPETYKQWQVRNLRAGFKQLGLNEDIMKKAREKVKKCYHKDFVVDADNGWLLQGWKGRIVYGMSTWKSAE